MGAKQDEHQDEEIEHRQADGESLNFHDFISFLVFQRVIAL